jgi:hypothetical protein
VSVLSGARVFEGVNGGVRLGGLEHCILTELGVCLVGLDQRPNRFQD